MVSSLTLRQKLLSTNYSHVSSSSASWQALELETSVLMEPTQILTLQSSQRRVVDDLALSKEPRRTQHNNSSLSRNTRKSGYGFSVVRQPRCYHLPNMHRFQQ